MTVHKDKILSSQLKIGMYICKLDRPWLETPFPFQGFYLRTKNELSEVQRFCEYVYVTVEEGKQSYKESHTHSINAPSPLLVKEKKKAVANKNPVQANVVQAKSNISKKFTIESDLKTIQKEQGRYEKKSKSFKKEINNAKYLFADLTRSVEQLSFNIRVGRKLDIKQTKALTKEVVSSVISNPNTMIWLSRLKDKGDYTYNHSLRASVLATVFGRYLGLDEKDLITLATGVLLSDIGKTKIPRQILNSSQELTKEEKELVLSHVTIGVDMLAKEKTVDRDTIVVVETHHERFNGSGYPYGLVGNEIPYLGQIAGLVDVFDAITNKKSYGTHMTPAGAMDWLYNQKGVLFAGDLIDDFVQAIGLYPAGTLVELTDDSVALVVSHNHEKRLRPEVLVLKDSNQKSVISNKTVDLSKRAFLSKVDRPMVRKALLPEELNITGDQLLNALNDSDAKKALFA